MNIGIDIRALLDLPYSGVGIYTFHLLQSLFTLDTKNQYFLFYNAYKDARHLLPQWDFPNVRFCGFRYPNKILNASMCFFSRPRIDSLVETTYLSNNVPPKNKLDLFFMPNWCFSSFRNCKTILTVHDLSIFQLPHCYSWKRRLWHQCLGLTQLINKTDIILCVSAHTAQDVKRIFHVPPEKTRIIAEGFDSTCTKTFTEAAEQEILTKYHLAPQGFILVLGNVEPRKNILGAIVAFEAYKKLVPHEPMELVIAGSHRMDPPYVRVVQKKIKNSPYASSLHLLGYVLPQEKPVLLKDAALLLFLSFYEGFGLPLLEAMSSGTPIVASYAGSIPEILQNVAPLVSPHRTHEVPRIIEQMLHDPQLKKRYIQRGMARALEFSWEKTARETLALFHDLVK